MSVMEAKKTPEQRHQHCVNALAGVQLPRKFSRRALASAIEHYTRRDLGIEVIPRARIAGAFGIICRSDQKDYIFLAAEANEFSQTFTIGHEFGHLLAGHLIDTVDDALVRIYGPEGVLLLPDYQRHFSAARCFQRSDDEAEMDADELARQIIVGVTGVSDLHEQLPGAGRGLLTRVFG